MKTATPAPHPPADDPPGSGHTRFAPSVKFPWTLLFALFVALFVVWVFRTETEYPSYPPADGFPTFEVEYIHGPPAASDQPLILDFWATWCAPCRDSIPMLNRLYAKFQEEGLQIIGITQEDRRTVDQFLGEFPIDYTVALDRDSRYFSSFAISSIPHLVLIATNGDILWRGHPMELPESLIERIVESSS